MPRLIVMRIVAETFALLFAIRFLWIGWTLFRNRADTPKEPDQEDPWDCV